MDRGAWWPAVGSQTSQTGWSTYNPTGLGSHLTVSFNLNTSSQVLSPNALQSQWALGLQHMNCWGWRHTSIQSIREGAWSEGQDTKRETGRELVERLL